MKTTINMQLLPISSYLFRSVRREKNLTLKEASLQLDIDVTYLNKIENGRVDIPGHVYKALLRLYDLNEEQINYCDFDCSFIDFYIYKVASSSLTEENLEFLNMKRKKYHLTNYEIYLALLMVSYKAFRQIYDDDFFIDLKDLDKLVHTLPDRYQYFFYTIALHYAIRSQDMELYNKYDPYLHNYHYHFLDVINAYTYILYDLFTNQSAKLLEHIQACTKALKDYPNPKIENALSFIEARYYHDLHDDKRAIQIYEEFSSRVLINQEMDNYGIAQNNIGFIYNQQKQYQKAIEHYLKAEPYMNYGDFYFDLAWCYYCLKDETNALKFISKGKNAIIEHKKWQLFLEWLECHVSLPYGKRGAQKLSQLYTTYFEDCSIAMKKFLLIALINQAKHDGKLKLENEYLIELVQLTIESNHAIDV